MRILKNTTYKQYNQYQRNLLPLKVALIIGCSVLTLFHADPACAATENDLREVMGLGRLDTDEDAQKQAMAIISECARDTEYNELVSMLDDYGLDDYTAQVELMETGKSAYEEMMSAFQGGASVQEVTSSLSVYESYYQNWEDISEPISYALELVDTADIEERLAYANTMLATVGSTEDIGEVGIDAPTITKEERMVISGLKDGEMSVATEKKGKIYAAFNGKVTFVGTNYISLSCGSTIELTYYGITPTVDEGQAVRQGRKVGTARGNNVSLSMKITGMEANPLLMYGKRGVLWYEDYVNGCALDNDDIIQLAASGVKDRPEGTAETNADENTETNQSFDNTNTSSILDDDVFLELEPEP